MKYFILFAITTILAVFLAHNVSAQTVTPSPTQSITETQQIQDLKSKVASRVAQLNLVQKKGIIGTISDTGSNQITIIDIQGKTRFVDVDAITKFSSQGSKTFGLSDLTKNTQITVLGIYNKDSQRILARFISSYSIPQFITGAINTIDKTNYYLTVISEDQKQTKLNIDTNTQLSVYTSDQGITRYGFSKIALGDRIFALTYQDKKDLTLFNASRLIDLINLPKNPKIMISVSSTLSPTTSAVR